MIALIHTSRLSPANLVGVFCGRPLLEWAVLQARACAAVERIVVVSGDGSVTKLADGLGIEVFAPVQDDDGPAAAEAFAASESTESDILVLPAEMPLRRAQDLQAAVDSLPVSGSGYVYSAVLPRGVRSSEEGKAGLAEGAKMPDAGLFYLLRGKCFENGFWTRAGTAVAVAPWQSQMIGCREANRACACLFGELVRADYPGSSLVAADLDLVVYDFDGVMTDNRVYVSQDGVETVAANRSDGLGVAWLKAAGVPQMILSTEKNPVVATRAKKLGLPVLQGIGDKAAALKRHCEESGYELARVLFVGNDLNDEEVMRLVGHPVCPADAYPPIRELAELVLRTRGGFGVLRELAERLVGPR